jgi:hypothetical protein
MNCDVKITAAEFSKIHNALWELGCLRDRFSGVIHPDLFANFDQAIANARDALKGAYDQDDAAYERKIAHYQDVADKLGLEAAWSMHEVDDLNAQHSFKGAKFILYKDHRGDGPVRVKIDGDTWASLYAAAGLAIKASGDNHHIFIEDFRLAENGEDLILSTGS